VLDLPDETCDDGNNVTGDGCSSQCNIEPGFDCNTDVAPSVCIAKTCGDEIRVTGEECDNGNNPGCSDCLIVQGFTCHVPFFKRSVCFNCGNCIVEESEECDNGHSDDIDGCNDTECTVHELWECTADTGSESVCEHIPVDLNAADPTTLNPPVIIFDGDRLRFFLIEQPGQLDIGKFTTTNWQSVDVLLSNPTAPNNILTESISYDRGIAADRGRITLSEFTALSGAIGETEISIDFASGQKVIRLERLVAANLTHVLLSLQYSTSSDPSGEFRYANITVVDIYGIATATVTVTLRFVGANDHSPVVAIPNNVARLLEGTQTVRVTNGSLTVTDEDSDFFPIKSAIVKIEADSDTFVYQRINISDLPRLNITVTYNESLGELSLVGDASEEEYETALNSVVYVNTAEDIGGLPFDEVVISFSVSDGKNAPGMSTAIVRLININDGPVLSINGQVSANLSYEEGGNPVSLPNNSVRISDSDSENIIEMNITLVNKQTGDNISVITTGTMIAVTGDQHLTLRGSAPLAVYEKVVSSLTFFNVIPSPSNLSITTRLITLTLFDGKDKSDVVQIRVTVIPLNDGPIVQFNPDADLNAFALLADRSHAVELIEEGLPVRVMPNTTTATDVDSTSAGRATVRLTGIKDGVKEALIINESLANSFGITVTVSVSDTSVNITLDGIASFEAYKEILLTLLYENTEVDEPLEGARLIVITLFDNEGAASLPVFITVNVTRRNDVPELDVGVGFGVDDEIEFVEIAQGANGVGIPIVSRPHRINIRNEEEETEPIQQMTITLRATGCGVLDELEFVYLPFQCSQSLKCEHSDDGKSISVSYEDDDVADSVAAMESTLQSAYYLNQEDEPTVYCMNVANQTVMFDRFIDVTITDGGSPPLKTTVSIRVVITFVNDHSPEVSLVTVDGCEVDPDDGGSAVSLHAMNARKKRYVVESQAIPKREAPEVLFVKAVNVPVGRLQAGSSLMIKFSHDTNMPPVLRPADLNRILTLSPLTLVNTSHMAFWTEPHTLAVVFPAMSNDESVPLTNVYVCFKGVQGNCNSSDVCEFGVCHADGWSCSVAGSYGIYPTGRQSVDTVSAADIEQTPLYNWCLVVLACACFIAVATVAVAMRQKQKQIK
jgi:cysteine-rich repeat protein